MDIELTTEQEIEVLKRTRAQLASPSAWTTYICLHIIEWCREQFPRYKFEPWKSFRHVKLITEIEELIDGEDTVDSWLGASSQIALTYRIAIIDTLLARRGVFL